MQTLRAIRAAAQMGPRSTRPMPPHALSYLSFERPCISGIGLAPCRARGPGPDQCRGKRCFISKAMTNGLLIT